MLVVTSNHTELTISLGLGLWWIRLLPGPALPVWKRWTMKDTKITFKLESQRLAQLQAVALKEGVTVSAILRQLTSKYLDFCKSNGLLDQR